MYISVETPPPAPAFSDIKPTLARMTNKHTWPCVCFGKRARECATNVFTAEMGEKFVSAAPGDIIIRPNK